MKKEMESLEHKISLFLRYGVMVAGFFMLIGLIASFDMSKNPFEIFSVYRHSPLMTELSIAQGNGDWRRMLSYAGLFLLISLPMLRVLLTGILFIQQKEYRMGAIALIVFAALILSFSLGIEL